MNFCHSPCPDISGDLIENLLVEAKLTSKEILAFPPKADRRKDDKLLLFCYKSNIAQHMSEQIIFYIVGSGIFVMWIHFAIHIRREFSIWVMLGIFVLGGVIGYQLDSMIVGFLFAMVFTFLFW